MSESSEASEEGLEDVSFDPGVLFDEESFAKEFFSNSSEEDYGDSGEGVEPRALVQPRGRRGTADHEREVVLVGAAQAGDVVARNELLERYVVVAERVAKEPEFSRLSRDDLVQEGVLGLARAISKFDPTNGAPFAAYARVVVRDAMRRAVVESSRVVVLPRERYRAFFRIRRKREELAHTLGRAPNSDEVGAALGLSPQDVDEIELDFQPMAELPSEKTDDKSQDDPNPTRGVPHKSESPPTYEVEDESEVVDDGKSTYSRREVEALLDLYPELYARVWHAPSRSLRLLDLDLALDRLPFEEWQAVTHLALRGCYAVEVSDLLALDRGTVARLRERAVARLVAEMNSPPSTRKGVRSELIWRVWLERGLEGLPRRGRPREAEAFVPSSLGRAKELCRVLPGASLEALTAS